MEASCSSKRNSKPQFLSLSIDLICAIFALLDHIQLIRCSVVCKSWKNVILNSTLMRDLYCSKNPKGNPNSTLISMNKYLENLAMEQHRLGFLNNFAKVYQWNAHSVRINQCRMKRGLFLTGGEDKVLRVWSAESYKCLDEYAIQNMNPLVDYDFDENKIVGIASARLFILRRNRKQNIFQFCDGNSTRGLCMRYIDPEAVVGCDDGRARVIDIYSGSCSRIIRMHGGPITSIALTEDQLIFGGSTFGTVTMADLSTGELLASLKSSFSPTGMKSLCHNMHSHLLFAGSTSGYAHCWDLRTLRPLWETRVGPNVIYSIHHLTDDRSTLAVGGLDGVLRLLDQNSGEPISSFVVDGTAAPTGGKNIEMKRATSLPEGVRVDSIPRSVRPPITSLVVGLNKIVTTHNDKYVRMWRFGNERW